MGAKSTLSWIASALFTTPLRRSFLRAWREMKRRLGRRPHEILYFHRADDPYCQLMVQILPEIARRFSVQIRPIVVERLPAEMYPDPARYEAYTIVDAARVARLYGLGFPSDALVPDALATSMVNRFLAARTDDPDFFSLAEEVGTLLWRRADAKIKEVCKGELVEQKILRANERYLHQLGYYGSASLYYEGEWYGGVDRLDHLERRLNGLGIGDNEVYYDLARLWRFHQKDVAQSAKAQKIELYFSIRSPYSYIALHKLPLFAAETGVALVLKPVLPMVTRGLKVPKMKRHYMVQDAKREAEAAGLPFGKICDPLGKAVENALQIGCYLLSFDPAQASVFFRAFTKAVWAEGVNGASESGLAFICEKAGLSRDIVREARQDTRWHQMAEDNRLEMLRAGSWGVPTIKCGNMAVWGQDRIWRVVEELRDDSRMKH